MENKFKPSIYWLAIFIPIGLGLDLSHASAPLISFSAALAIIPIARLIGATVPVQKKIDSVWAYHKDILRLVQRLATRTYDLLRAFERLGGHTFVFLVPQGRL